VQLAGEIFLENLGRIFKGEFMEHWLSIDEFPRYSVSDQGRVRNDDTGRILATTINQAGVVMVGLTRDGRQYKRGVAKLVADRWLPHHGSDDIFTVPMHLDGNRRNNAANNLLWRPRWYAAKYLNQFERYRPPFVNCPIIETQTGAIFENSWEATITYGVLETHVAQSFHAFQGAGEIQPAWPLMYTFRRYDGE
jgi:hypothetical protein